MDELISRMISEASNLVAGLAITGTRLLLVLAMAAVAIYVVRRMLRVAERTILRRAQVSADRRVEYEKRTATVMTLLHRTTATAIWLIAGVIMLSLLGLNITPIITGAGILGLAVGFGAQNLVRDVISGVLHLLENQVRLGDVVQIDGISGVVEDITYRVIILRDAEQTVHVFPHGRIGRLSNMTKDRSAMVLDVAATYSESPDAVMAALQAVGEAMMNDEVWRPKLLEPLEVLGVNGFGESAILYRVRYKTRPSEQWGVKREFLRRVKLEFESRALRFPFPHRTIDLTVESAAPHASVEPQG